MQIRPTSNIRSTTAINLQPQAKTNATSSTTSVPVDQLNISAEAQMMSATSPGTDVRADRVADIRAQIAGGQYETSEKMDLAIGRMLNEIG